MGQEDRAKISCTDANPNLVVPFYSMRQELKFVVLVQRRGESQRSGRLQG